MGAVPSRETHRRGFFQLPDYGSRQRMVLIPLTKAYFPSADCRLLRELFEVRCDPFVRYYFSYEENVRPAGRSRSEGGADAANSAARTNGTGDAETLPLVDFTSEEFYKAYVCRAGESRLFDTNRAMLDAYEQNPRRVRPVPCAVALIYEFGPAVTTCSSEDQHGRKESLHLSNEDEGDEVGGGTSGRKHCTRTLMTGDGYMLEDCVDICDWKVQVVGFVGDVSAFSLDQEENDLVGRECQLQMFMRKSVGDHNYMNILFTAVYTYAAQWQDALVAEGRHKADVLLSVGQPQVKKKKKRDMRLLFGGEAQWPLPPICSVFTVNRRENVPAMCFQRSVRLMFYVMDIAMQENGDGDGEFCGEEAFSCDVTKPLNGRTTPREEKASKSARDGEEDLLDVHSSLKGNTALSADDMRMYLKNDMVLTVFSEDLVARVVRHVVECIFRQIHPVDNACNKRPLSPSFGVVDPLSAYRLFPCRDTRGSEAVDVSAIPVVEKTTNGVFSNKVSGVAKEMDTTGVAVQRFPDEPVVVEAWPDEGVDLAALDAGVNGDVAAHYFWVVGNSEAARRTAATAFAAWKSSGRRVEIDAGSAPVSFDERDVISPMMAVGASLHLVALAAVNQMSSRSPRGFSVLRCGFLPVEELLLAELRGASKAAREAEVRAANWVRHKEGAKPLTSVHLSPSYVASSDNGTQASVAAAVSQLVGDSTLCLWRVPLCTGAVRVIAVTPKFARLERRTRTRLRRMHFQLIADQLGAGETEKVDATSSAYEEKRYGKGLPHTTTTSTTESGTPILGEDSPNTTTERTFMSSQLSVQNAYRGQLSPIQEPVMPHYYYYCNCPQCHYSHSYYYRPSPTVNEGALPFTFESPMGTLPPRTEIAYGDRPRRERCEFEPLYNNTTHRAHQSPFPRGGGAVSAPFVCSLPPVPRPPRAAAPPPGPSRGVFSPLDVSPPQPHGDGAKSHAGATAGPNPLMQISARTGTYRWDWRRSHVGGNIGGP